MRLGSETRKALNLILEAKKYPDRQQSMNSEMTTPLTPGSLRTADVTGAAMSIACLAHCMAAPIAAVVLPTLGVHLDHILPHETKLAVHGLFALLAIPLALRSGAFAGRQGRADKKSGADRLLGIGLCLIVLALPIEIFDEGLHTTLTVAGASLLLLGHSRLIRCARTSLCR